MLPYFSKYTGCFLFIGIREIKHSEGNLLLSLFVFKELRCISIILM